MEKIWAIYNPDIGYMGNIRKISGNIWKISVFGRNPDIFHIFFIWKICGPHIDFKVKYGKNAGKLKLKNVEYIWENNGKNKEFI